MRCDSCGVEIPQQQLFCMHCGAPRPVSTQPKGGKKKAPVHKPDSGAGATPTWGRILVLLIFLLGLLLLLYVFPLVR